MHAEMTWTVSRGEEGRKLYSALVVRLASRRVFEAEPEEMPRALHMALRMAKGRKVSWRMLALQVMGRKGCLEVCMHYPLQVRNWRTPLVTKCKPLRLTVWHTLLERRDTRMLEFEVVASLLAQEHTDRPW
jgi:hypothetical protein